MDRHNILSLLGLALRGGNLVVGEEPVESVSRAKDARLLVLASDAAENTRRRTEHFAGAGQCLWLRLPFTKAELGQAVGRSSAAIAAVTDIGLANALVKKLADLDSERYGETARRMEIKFRRAQQRRAEQLAHEKNLRAGKRRPKKTAETPSGKRRTGAQSTPVRQGAAEEHRPFRRRAAPGGTPRREKQGPGKRPNPYAHSRPVKKGKGSFRKREDGRSQ